MIIALRWLQDSPMQQGILSRLAESLRLKLANMPGTEIAESWGDAEEELLISIDPYKLASANISAAQVAASIRSADTKLPSGRLRSNTTDMLVEVEAELSSPERIARIPLAITPSGNVLRVSDVAQVQKSQVNPPNSLAFNGDEQVVLVNAKMQGGLQVESWTENALAVVSRFKATLPGEIGLDIVYNQNQYTGERMQSLGTNLLFALVIVMLVLVWFMGVRSAFTVGIALPLSGGMVLLGMQLMDIPLHQMSVTGLIISLGLLIDNAIVVVEDYKLRRRHGEDIPEAISKAIKHLLVPLGASTATTVFAFMPIALAPGGVAIYRHHRSHRGAVCHQLLYPGNDHRANGCRVPGK